MKSLPLATKVFLPCVTWAQVRHNAFLQWYIPTNGIRVSCLSVVDLFVILILLGAILPLILGALRYANMGTEDNEDDGDPGSG